MKKALLLLIVSILVAAISLCAWSCAFENTGAGGTDECTEHLDKDDDGICDNDGCEEEFSDGCDIHTDEDGDDVCDTEGCDTQLGGGCSQHRDSNDDGYCDNEECNIAFEDGCDLHKDSNDDGFCDNEECNIAFEDGCDVHEDADDDGFCDNDDCGKKYSDGCDNHVDGDDDGVCDVNGCGTPWEDGVDLVEKVTLSLVEKGTNANISKLRFDIGYTLTNEDIQSILDTYYHGYKYASWTNSTGAPICEGMVLDASMSFYGDRGDLAGENITWSVDLDTSTLTLSGTGEMFDFEYNDDAPWINYASFIENIVFDGNITSIGACSFYNFGYLGTVTLPEGITKIGTAAFYNSSITDINFPSTLLTIEANAFNKCNSITKLIFNEGLTYIGGGAFYECTGVVDVILTDKIAELGGSAFYHNTNLQTAYYVGTKEQYDKMIVRLDNFWIQQLANTYYLSPTQPEEPGPYWHYDNNGNVVNWYYTIGYMSATGKVPFAFDYVDPTEGITQRNIDNMRALSFNGYKFASWRRVSNNRAFNFIIGTVLDGDIRLRGVRGAICGDDMTYSYDSSTGHLSIDGTGRMWDFAGTGDAPWVNLNVVTVSFSSGVEYIGSNAFCNQLSITYLDIPVTITGMHEETFVGCNNLLYLYYEGNAEQLSRVDGISNLKNLANAKVYAYNNESQPGEGYHWRYVTGLASEGEKRVAWGLEDGTLTVGGDVALVNYNSEIETPWYLDRESVREIVIIDKANRVGAYSFYGMSAVTAITVPDSVAKIAATAFMGTGYYDNTENYEDGALYISKHLIKVLPSDVGEIFVMRDNTISIAEGAFDGCTPINKIVFAKTVKGIYRGALSGLSSLEAIMFLGNAESAWEAVWQGSDFASQGIDSVTVYYYSKNQPSGEGNFWHNEYVSGVGMVPTVW